MPRGIYDRTKAAKRGSKKAKAEKTGKKVEIAAVAKPVKNRRRAIRRSHLTPFDPRALAGIDIHSPAQTLRRVAPHSGEGKSNLAAAKILLREAVKLIESIQ